MTADDTSLSALIIGSNRMAEDLVSDVNREARLINVAKKAGA